MIAGDCLRLPRFYPILDQATLDARGEDLRTLAGELCSAGVEILQYRAKLLSPQEILRGAEAISEAFRGSAALLVLNDRPDLAVLAGWSAVHVGQGDLPVSAARKVFGAKNAWVGVSTHTETQLLEAEQAEPDYIAVGPVFVTGSKRDAEPVVGLDGVRRARALTRKPLVAIGGVTQENARSVMDAGADCVAAIGALLAPGKRPGQIAADFLKLLS